MYTCLPAYLPTYLPNLMYPDTQAHDSFLTCMLASRNRMRHHGASEHLRFHYRRVNLSTSLKRPCHTHTRTSKPWLQISQSRYHIPVVTYLPTNCGLTTASQSRHIKRSVFRLSLPMTTYLHNRYQTGAGSIRSTVHAARRRQFSFPLQIGRFQVEYITF